MAISKLFNLFILLTDLYHYFCVTKIHAFAEGPTMAVEKKRKKTKKGAEVIYLILSILVILVFLFILLRLYYRNREQPWPSTIGEGATEVLPASVAEAMAILEKLRKQKDFGRPVLLTHSGIQLLEYRGFSLGYDEKHEQAAWVAYLLPKEHALNSYERRNRFRADRGLLSGSATPGDYTNSGYDRGHLAPAADFDYDRKALNETFLMTNISPQHPSFNRGGWKELEELVRSWASEYDSLYVITGPVLEPGLKKIGENGVSVPNFFYKIIMDTRQPQVKMIGFLMPNQKITGGPWAFVVSVDSIEHISGLDFFPQLPDLLEDSLENMIQTKYWKSTR
jgi:endonuclease G